MAVNDSHVTRLVQVAAEALEQEDRSLFAELQAASQANKFSHGIPMGLGNWIREDTVMFLVYRALLRDPQFPLEVSWEYQYPQAGIPQRMDLALFERSTNPGKVPDACVEAKWWGGNEPVQKDIRKMKGGGLPAHMRKFVFLVGQHATPTFATVLGWAGDSLPITLKPEWHKTFKLRREQTALDRHWPFFYLVVGEVRNSA